MARGRAEVRVVASTRDARRGRRSLVPVVIAVVTLGAFALGRMTAHPSHTRDAGSNPAGPRRAVNGVPVGFAHSREGAVAALLNYGAALGDPRVMLDARRRTQVLAVIATSTYASTFRRGASAFEEARRGPLGRGLAAGAQTAYLASPIAYRVVSYTPDRAVVEGWGVAVVGNDQAVKPQAAWATTLTTARWQRGDWRIDAVRSTDGPTPALAPGQRPSSPGDFLARLSGLRGVRHAP